MKLNIFKKMGFITPLVGSILILVSCNNNSAKEKLDPDVKENNGFIFEKVENESKTKPIFTENNNKFQVDSHGIYRSKNPKSISLQSKFTKRFHDIFGNSDNLLSITPKELSGEKASLWNEGINLFKKLEDIFSQNILIYYDYKDFEYFKKSLEEFLNAQEKTPSIASGESTHFRSLYKDFFENPTQQKIQKWINACSPSGIKYLKTVVYKQINEFIDYQLRNRDLVFDISKGYKPNLENLLFIEEGKTEEIKKVRRELVETGFSAAKFQPGDFYVENLIKIARKKYPSNQLEYGTGENSYYDAVITKIWYDYAGSWGAFSGVGASYEHGEWNEIVLDKNYNLLSVPFPNRFSSVEYKEIKLWLLDVIPQIISNDFSDEQKIRAIHNFICHRIKYAINEFNADPRGINWRIRNPYAIVDGQDYKGVCETYSRTFNLFTTFINMKSNYVIGNAFHAGGNVEPHAWSNVWLENKQKWVYLDLTWDDNNKGKDMDKYGNKEIIPFNYEFYLQDWRPFITDRFSGRLQRDIWPLLRQQEYMTKASREQFHYPLPNRYEVGHRF
ncbi:transglutaminase domain-containing protein [Mycoplasma sp. Mirounga ES2805-ORL]|uniref:transglutaminase domain-containing protein n=1 Tax=Mycoplasma sp. Mirounga ES2805-ORL TaxID=754514 RepID=UPI00197B7F76|nr:transglutaminase-like domain-containing protein [Mycoplasma sp. Mirounga ES2805-ORL]QSF13913.1 transglutaminase domain-containing protein [Mycoplasma sp. Mirounga ES2805-ORL]